MPVLSPGGKCYLPSVVPGAGPAATVTSPAATSAASLAPAGASTPAAGAARAAATGAARAAATAAVAVVMAGGSSYVDQERSHSRGPALLNQSCYNVSRLDGG